MHTHSLGVTVGPEGARPRREDVVGQSCGPNTSAAQKEGFPGASLQRLLRIGARHQRPGGCPAPRSHGEDKKCRQNQASAAASSHLRLSCLGGGRTRLRDASFRLSPQKGRRPNTAMASQFWKARRFLVQLFRCSAVPHSAHPVLSFSSVQLFLPLTAPVLSGSLPSQRP